MTWIVNRARAPPIARRNPKNSWRSPSPKSRPMTIMPTPRMFMMGVSRLIISTMTPRIEAAMEFPIPPPSRARVVGAVVVSAIVDSRTTNHTIVFIFLAFVRHRRAAAAACPLPRRRMPGAHPGLPFPGILRGHRVLSPPPLFTGLTLWKRLLGGHGDGGRGSYLSSSPSSPRPGPIAAFCPLFHRDLAAASVRRGVRQACRSYRRSFI